MTEVGLSWSAATDNVGVEGYHVYRDDTHLHSLSETNTSDPDRTPETLYCYAVSAYDAAGNESERSIESCISIGNESPVAVLEGPESEPADVEVVFDGTESRDADGAIVSYTFDFGDGTVVTRSTPIATHTYRSASTYTVSLTVVDDWGATGSASHETTIGIVLGPVVEVSNLPAFAQYEAFCRDSSGAVNAVWEEGQQIAFARSDDGGRAFSEPAFVAAPGTFDRATQMDIACGDSTVHVAWTVFDPNLYGIYYARSADGGSTFSEPIRISAVQAGGYAPQVASNGSDGVGVVWNQEKNSVTSSIYRGSVDDGLSFLDERSISSPQGCAAVGLSETEVYVVWRDRIGERLLLTRSDDGGNTFIPAALVDDSPDRDWCAEVIADPTGTVHLAGLNRGASGRVILYSRSTDRGLTFEPPRQLSSEALKLGWPQLAAGDAGRVYVLASQSYATEGRSSFLIFSGDGGASFTSPLRFRSEESDQIYSNIVAGPGHEIGLGWHPGGGGSSLSGIYYRSAEVTGR
jgi:PKD repeat protein